MSVKVEDALKAREDRKKKSIQEKQDKVNSAYEVYKSRKQNNAKTAVSDLASRINQEIEKVQKVTNPSWGSDSLGIALESTRESRLNLEKLTREVESYKNYFDEETYNSLSSVLGQLNGTYDSYLQIAEGRSQYESEEDYKQNYPYAKIEDEINSVRIAPDFTEKSGYVSSKADNLWGKMFSQYDLGYNDLAHEYINNQNGLRDEIKSKYRTYTRDNLFAEGEISYEEKGYDFLKEEEIAVYNYYYNTEGKERAQQFLDSMEETLVKRKADEEYLSLEDNTLKEIFYGIVAGTEQFRSGIENIGHTIVGDKGTTPSSQYVSEKVREDLADKGPKILGSSIGQIGYDLVNTTSNMLPSILVGSATGGLGGAITLGASASGNAYSEMRRLGYNAGQARAYAVLVGASETLLSSVLGGISALGGGSKGVFQTIAGKIVPKLDKAIARVAIQVGGNVLDEGLEEALQEVLDPIFKKVATGEEFEGIDIENVLYSGLLGMLSGGLLEGAPTIAGTAINSHNAKELYGNSQQDIVTEALKYNPENAHAQRMQTKLDKGKNLSGYQLNRLVEETDPAKISSATKARLTELGEKGDVSKLAEVLAKQATGEKLSLAEKAIIKQSQYGERVANELNPENINSGEYSTSWAENIGTKRINASSYNKQLYDLARSQAEARQTLEQGAVAKTIADAENAVEGKYTVSEDGKTIYTADGKSEDVNINKIVSTEGGKVKVELDNGKTVDISALSLSSAEEGIMYEMVARMELAPEAANEFISTYKPTNAKQAMQYLSGVPLAYQYGKIGYEAGLDNISLTDKEKRIAYNRGRMDAVTEAKSQPKASATKNAKGEVSKGKNGIIYENDFTYNEETASDVQKASMAGIETIAKMSSLEVHVYESYIADNGKRVYKLSGREGSAPNGFFTDGNKIYIDINAGNKGEGAMLYTMSHEVTHYIRKWNAKGFKVLGDFLIEQYGEHGVPVQALLESQKDKIKKRYNEERKTLPSEAKLNDMAYEELVADAMSDMFADPKAYEKLAKLKQKNHTVWQKLGEAIKNLLDKLKSLIGAYKNYTPDAVEAHYVRKFAPDVYEKLQDLYLKAFVEADANYEATIGTRNLHEFEAAKNENGETLFQYRAMEADEDTYRHMLQKWGKMSTTQIDNLFATIDNAMELIKDNLEILDYAWEADIDDRAFSPVKPNSDKLYQVSLDFSTLCRKRILQQTVAAQLQEALNKPLSREEGIAIRDALIALQEEGRQIEVACALCYVESARMKSPEQIKRFMADREKVIKEFFAGKSGGNIKDKIKQAESDAKERLHKENPKGILGKDGKTMLDPRNASLKSLPKKYADKIRDAKRTAKESYKPTDEEQKLIEVAKGMTVSDFTSPEGLENLAKKYPSLFDAYTSYVRNATKSKGIEGDTWWRAGDSMKIGDVLIANMNKENGLRSQSWSDFQVIHILDYIASTIELATRETKEQAYSKVPDYVELMGNTGVMINMSLIPTASFTGSLDYDSVEGIDYKRALELRDKYHKTAGTICIGIDNAQIKLLLADGTIDYVIPYHKSGMSKALRKLMHMPTWSDYESYQSESNLSRAEAKKRAEKYGVALLAESDPNYHKGTSFSEWFDLKEAQQIAKMENANPSDKAKQKKYGVMYGGYMAMQNAANNYLKLCAERGLSPKFSHEKADFTTEDNYWKLLIDRKMVDNVTGEVIEQQNIKPIFNEGEIMRILNDELARYPKVKADQDYAIRTVTEKMLSGEVKGGMSSKDIAKVMKKPVDNVTNVNILASAEDMKLSDRDSHGNELSAEQQAFYKDSKARDEDGNLLVLYHGTSTEQRITEFKTTEGWRTGLWLTTDHETAVEFAKRGPNNDTKLFTKENSSEGSGRHGVYELYANVKNPLIVDAQSHRYYAIPRPSVMGEGDAVSGEEINAFALKNGYDGVIIKDVIEGSNRLGTDVIVFSPNQAKYTDNLNPTEGNNISYSDRDSDYEDYSRPITVDDVEVLRPMKDKSVNDFTSDDIKNTQKWAYKFYQELGEKSPFFRAWFGDWRAFDKNSTKIIDISRTEGKNPRGKFHNKDTGWEINSSSVGYDETISHSGKNKKSIIAMQNIDKIIENAILLDTEVSEYGRGKKSIYTAFMHKFYALCRINGKLYIAKMAVDESYAPGQNDTNKKFYHVRAIEIETASSVGIGESHTPIIEDTVSNTSIADLFKFVKSHDDKFKPKAVNPLLLNDDGTPKVFYHGTNKNFSVFDIERAGSNWNGDSRLGKGFYFAHSEQEALRWTEGTNVIKAYLNLKNPLNVDAPTPENIAKEIDKYIANKIASFDENSSFISKEQYIKNLERIKDMYMNDVSMFIDNFKYDDNGKMTDGIREFLSSLKYDGIISKDEVVAFYPNQIKSATDNIGTFNKAEEDIQYSVRDSNSVSNRTLLANALESVAQNDIEKSKLAQYKAKIALIESEQKKLSEIKAKAQELRFTKGRTPSETKQMRDLDFEATQIANRISTYDKQLLNLESTSALKSVLEREKKMLRKKLEQKGKDAIKAQKEKAAETVRELMTRHQESRQKAIEGRHKTELRNKIKDVVSDLNKLLLNPTKDQHVPIGLQRVVAEALDAINMDTMNAEERVAYYNDLISKSSDPDEIKMLTKKRDYFEYHDMNFKDRITALKNAYAEFKESEDPLIRNAHNDAIEDLIKNTADEVGNKSLKDMSYEQLEAVHDMYKAIKATVRNANKLFKEGRQETITENSESVKTEVKEVGGHHERVNKLTKVFKFRWNLLKPIYAFQRIGSKTLTSLFNNVRAGEDTYAMDVSEAREYFQAKSTKYNYSSWDFKKRYSFKDSVGNDFSLSLEQIMSLYAYSKREQADKHLEVGGFVFDDAIEVTEKGKLHIPIKYEVNDANPYRLRAEDLATVTSSLTSEQKNFIDEMQTFLSEVMGAKGNEVSLALYDIKLYKEKNYFPLKTSRYFREFNPEQSGNPMLRNSGFSKKTVPQAGNPIVLSNFMDVWTSHVNEMSMYHSFVLPLEDFMRVYNYSSKAGGYDSVQQYIKNAYGADANQYIEKLMQDINGGVMSGNIQNGMLKMFGKFKKVTVAASASTIVQQPTAVIRAMAKINPKYFIGVPFYGNNWEEIKKYAPIAVIKEMGGIDVGSGRQAKDYIEAKTYKGFSKIKGFFTDANYRDGIFMWGATKADELGWNSIWKAVKREVASEQKLKPGTEEFLKASGKRFTEVITQTQVYDSVFSRNGLMRDKGDLNKFATSFMGEPTTSLNMIYGAILDAKRGGSKAHAAREIASVYSSIVAASVLASLVYALRDDDEDESYLEKYTEALGNKLSSEIWIHNMIPYFRDVASIIEGWDVERPDMSIFADIKSSFDKLYKINEDGEFEWRVDFSDPNSVLSAIENFGGSIAAAFGLPAKNIIRTGREIYNIFENLFDDISGGNRWHAFVEGWTGEEADKSTKLYNAIVNGDEARLEVYKKSYKNEKSFESAVKEALRENDSRIHEAAQAKYEGDIAEYTRIAKEIISEGKFSQDTVVGAINAEVSAIKKGETTEEEPEEEKDKATSIYSASDINAALDNGDTSTALDIIDDLIETKVANGMTEKEAKSSLRSSMTSYWKPLYKKAYESGNSSEMARIRKILYASGLYGNANEVVKSVNAWLKD